MEDIDREMVNVDKPTADRQMSTLKNGNVKTKIKVVCDTDDVETGTHANETKGIERVVRRFQTTMALFGLYNKGTSHQNGKHYTVFGKVLSLLCQKKKYVYQLMVLLSMISFFVRGVLSFFIGEHASDFTTFRLTVLIWQIQVIIVTVLMIKSSHNKYGNQSKACEWCFNQVMPLFRELNVVRGTKSVRRQLLLAIFCGWVFITLNIVSVSFVVLFEQSSVHQAFVATLVSPLPVNIVTKSLVLVLNAYAAAAWMLSMVNVITFNLILKYSFKLSRQALYNAIAKTENKTDASPCLYKERILHLNISKLVVMLDKDFNYFFATWFVTNIPVACLLLYQIIKAENMDTLVLISYIFWLISNILPLSVTAGMAALTHDAAHSPLDHIYDVTTKNISPEQMGQLNLFLSKLNGSPIGFTVLNFITITKEVLLTVGGLYLTYFFVLWQF